MKIHFVCTGNTFRSRLAEAYLNSKKLSHISVSSSGVDAYKDISGPVNWYSQRIIEQHGLVKSEKDSWTQTTAEILDGQDLVIFMQKWHYDQCVERFGFTGSNYEIWDIDDTVNANSKPDASTIKFTEDMYKKIVGKMDNLIARDFKPKNL
jgi:protein-tyrosine-phosphatase